MKMKNTILLLICLAPLTMIKAQQQDTISLQTEARFLFNPEFPASFPDGDAALKTFIRKNLEYPKKKGCEGEVFVQFTVEEDGSITNAEVLSDIGCGCGKKALKLLEKMPLWKPGTINNKPVRSRVVIPIEFNER